MKVVLDVSDVTGVVVTRMDRPTLIDRLFGRVWSMRSALSLIRRLDHETRKYGYHVGLCGGVLRVGHSQKDLDLILMRLLGPNTPEPDSLRLEVVLARTLGDWHELGSMRARTSVFQCRKYYYHGRRVDIFVELEK